MVFENLTEKIIACAIEVHRTLGPGLLESIYQAALAIELCRHDIRFQQQLPLQISYKGQHVGEYRIDLLVEESVVVELKSVERHDPVFEAQLLSYMKLGQYKVGLLINFNSVLLTKGVKRFVF